MQRDSVDFTGGTSALPLRLISTRNFYWACSQFSAQTDIISFSSHDKTEVSVIFISFLLSKNEYLGKSEKERQIPYDITYVWNHPYGRKQRGTKESLDESERGEWKSWLKTQHSKN